jgi:pyruvate,water dikinase
VAVRSSATGEDTAQSSFAGQQATFLWVRGATAVRRQLVSCWASLFSAEAISYRRHLGLDPAEAAMAVVVQTMVAAHAAGVMFTVDPQSGDPSQITIESTVGLGEPLVGGELSPDRHCVDKVTLEIRWRGIAVKPFADRFDPQLGSVRRMPLSVEEARASALEDIEVIRLAGIGKALERSLGSALDIEWALGPGDGEKRHIYLLQARPDTARRAHETATGRRASAIERIASGMRSET